LLGFGDEVRWGESRSADDDDDGGGVGGVGERYGRWR
jgi:hypothetical protein